MEQRWRHYRIDCILAIADQAKFIKNAMEAEPYPGEGAIKKYIAELSEMVEVLKKFAEEE